MRRRSWMKSQSSKGGLLSFLRTLNLMFWYDGIFTFVLFSIMLQNAAPLDSEIIYDRDFDYNYFGFKSLKRSYLLKVQGKVVERPQHMLMRVVVGIHKEDIDSAVKTYHLVSQRWFTHASPTLFNAGTPRPQVQYMLMLFISNSSSFCKHAV